MDRRSADDLLAEARAAGADPAFAARAMRLLDLTSLQGEAGDETADEIERLCRDAIACRAAAVCIYPRHLPLARGLLDGTGVRLATVAAFPHGGDDIAMAADETAAAVAEGADEVDVVAPIGALMEGDIGAVGELIAACRAAATPSTTLKLILETGVLAEPSRVTAAARAAVMAGVDFLKTSTGKAPVGATLDAALWLLAVIAEADGRVGLKVSGGVRTADDAGTYARLAELVLGEDWVTPTHFRIGASSLLTDLRRLKDA